MHAGGGGDVPPDGMFAQPDSAATQHKVTTGLPMRNALLAALRFNSQKLLRGGINGRAKAK